MKLDFSFFGKSVSITNTKLIQHVPLDMWLVRSVQIILLDLKWCILIIHSDLFLTFLDTSATPRAWSCINRQVFKCLEMSDHVQLKNDVNLFFFRIFISIPTIRRILVITSRDFTHYNLATSSVKEPPIYSLGKATFPAMIFKKKITALFQFSFSIAFSESQWSNLSKN